MEFWFATTDVDTRALDAVVRRHVLPGLARPALAPATLNGMLKGFIDLVFEHEGRYHVADYKSNWLGPNDDAYTAQAMRDAILDHRYDLQYALYLFALHRFLRARLADYDYDTHVGGAAYVFLRGLGVHTERPPRALVDELDALFTATLSEPA
jgi:exodeoxyribonuclease V beta subunit